MFRFILAFSLFLASIAIAQRADALETQPPATHVKVFLQENLNASGGQIPTTPELIRVLKYFEKQSGVKFELIILPWKRAQVETLAGKGIIFGFSKSMERLKHYTFSDAYIEEGVWAVTYGSPYPDYRSIADLKGKTVATGRGFSHGLEFDQVRDKLFTVQEDSASVASRFRKLILKRSDLMLWPVRELSRHAEVEKYLNTTVVSDANDPELQNYHFDVSQKPLFYDSNHFASAKGHFEAVLGKINTAIRRGKKNASLARIMHGYH